LTFGKYKPDMFSYFGSHVVYFFVWISFQHTF